VVSKKYDGYQNAVDQYLEHFDIDDHEAHIDEQVHQRSKWSLTHFALSKRYLSHGFPA